MCVKLIPQYLASFYMNFKFEFGFFLKQTSYIDYLLLSTTEQIVNYIFISHKTNLNLYLSKKY